MPRYTVHNVPLILQPFLWIYGWMGGIGFWLHQSFYRLFCRIEYVGVEHVNENTNHIFSLWHENLPLFFIAHPRFRHPNIWLTYPLWFMKPVHIMQKIIGVQELAYGASGIDGKVALQQVLARLSEGWSTFLNPDGPKGPLKVAKNGVLLMSVKTNTPVIPLSFYVEKERRIPSWDRKRYPRLFSTLVVVYGKPIWVSEATWEADRTLISQGMDDPEGTVSGSTVLPHI